MTQACAYRARQLDAADQTSLPLYGIPFAIKDNIDFAGLPTTAGCPAFAYQPASSAPVVQALIDAGAIALGKTNLDQFATGLVGTRSPYGACRNAFDPAYISGGSSSGSAVAVALGLASFSLGTDTAGSGRVPAAFNNLVGYKPTLGSLSMRGVVPACRSLDAMSIFALTAEDAAQRGPRRGEIRRSRSMVADRRSRARVLVSGAAPTFRFAVPRAAQLEFFGNAAYASLFDAAVQRLRDLGGEACEVDIEPLLSTARLLYEGPWVAERYLATESLLTSKPEAMLDVTRQIISGGANPKALDAFRAQYRLKELTRAGAGGLGGGASIAATHGRHSLPHRRRAGGSHPAQQHARALHQFRESHGPRRRCGARRLHAARPAFRRLADRARLERRRSAGARGPRASRGWCPRWEPRSCRCRRPNHRL